MIRKYDEKVYYVSDAIALCNILDEFESFNEDLQKLKVNLNTNFRYDLHEISRGGFNFNIKARKFYQLHKQAIDKINTSLTIVYFLSNNYNKDCTPNKDFVFFYEYLNKNKNKLDEIKALLSKIKSLGFNELELKNTQFTDETYCMNINYPSTFYYLDNMEAIPNYQNSIVYYKTNFSNYRISIIPNASYDKFSVWRITVNSLLFDLDRLPNRITKNETIDKIVALKNDKKEVCTAIKNSVDLNISIEDLEYQIQVIERVIRLSSIESKEDMYKMIKEMLQQLNKLQAISAKYDEDIISKGIVTKEKLIQEKEDEQKRIFLARTQD